MLMNGSSGGTLLFSTPEHGGVALSYRWTRSPGNDAELWGRTKALVGMMSGVGWLDTNAMAKGEICSYEQRVQK